MLGTVLRAWVRALTVPLPEGPRPDAIWAEGGTGAPTAWIVRALRARLSHARRGYLDQAREFSRGVALQTPVPHPPDQLKIVAESFNQGALSRSVVVRMAHSQLVGATRSGRGFVHASLRSKLACAAPSRHGETDLLASLLHAARVMRICLWIVTRAERAQPDLLRLFEDWFSETSEPPHLLLELRQERKYWIITNLPAPPG